MTKAMFSFSADPIHYGHIDIIERGSKLFEEVVAGIGINQDKKGRHLFTLEERRDMAKQALSYLPNVRVVTYEGLTVDYAYNHNIPAIIKAVRNATDVEYEKTIDENNKSQKLGIETIPLFSNPHLSHISSTVAKELQSYHGNVHEHVPFNVKQALEAKISGQYILGITGGSGSGKSYLCDLFVEFGKRKGISVHHIEFDHIGHDILGTREKPVYETIQKQVVDKFGEKVRLSNGTINRKVLGEMVFNDYSKLQELNEIMKTPMLVDLRQGLNGHRGLILINGALIAEANLGYLCNNNVVLVDVDKETQRKRLEHRDKLTEEQIQRRVGSQYTFENKKSKLEEAVRNKRHGSLWIYQSRNDSGESEIVKLFDSVIDYFKINSTAK